MHYNPTEQLCVSPPVERPLEVSHPLEDAEAKERSSVTLSCGFSPSPRLVRWFKGRTALKTSNKYSMKRAGKRAELTIHGLTGMDAGQYRCMAGGSESAAHVKVEGRLKTIKRILTFVLNIHYLYVLLHYYTMICHN